MQVIKVNVERKDLTTKQIVQDECLKNGHSITKANVMGAKKCCGAAYIEQKE